MAGDICSNIMGLSYSVLNEDWALARGSILRVAAYPFEAGCVWARQAAEQAG